MATNDAMLTDHVPGPSSAPPPAQPALAQPAASSPQVSPPAETLRLEALRNEKRNIVARIRTTERRLNVSPTDALKGKLSKLQSELSNVVAQIQSPTTGQTKASNALREWDDAIAITLPDNFGSYPTGNSPPPYMTMTPSARKEFEGRNGNRHLVRRY